ncbi:15-cis-phytoene synthase [Methylobacterium mesophilicum]|uniref:phytoene/squalene synthase family protein n=1 Tax=Methylobacterium TaxID=407 RepID=UPI0011C9BACC|nr:MULTISPECIES: phytoene/squalene synthase family protein [Methylobacterium]TXN42229.1 squalene/phytoene synthase family protein [Methylobacterium sp. WL7]TXN66125.1 squalene/phytoene synthase family protein [Methylobacterium sp. WL18]GJE21328.1 15-cis-phytoene synthase [Methylobacterium mesophilicum]
MPEVDDKPAETGLAFAQAHCEQLVRDGDPDRYYATLFAPAAARPHLFALYAFSLTVARVREAASNPMAGEIRLQWWRDALQGEARGDVRANPVAAALEEAIRVNRLLRQPFVDLIDARVFDLYEDPMPRVNDLEGYCGETASALFRLASLVIGNGTEPGGAGAAGHAGVAYGITGLLRALPWHARSGQVYLPADVLARYGVTREDITSGRGGPGLRRACADLRDLARTHLKAFEAARPAIAPLAGTAFLPVALVEPYLAMMERASYDPLNTLTDLPRWRRLWRLWRASRRIG